MHGTRGTATAALAFALLLGAAIVEAAPLAYTVANCGALVAAVDDINNVLKNATKGGTVTAAITLSCSGCVCAAAAGTSAHLCARKRAAGPFGTFCLCTPHPTPAPCSWDGPFKLTLGVAINPAVQQLHACFEASTCISTQARHTPPLSPYPRPRAPAPRTFMCNTTAWLLKGFDFTAKSKPSLKLAIQGEGRRLLLRHHRQQNAMQSWLCRRTGNWHVRVREAPHCLDQLNPNYSHPRTHPRRGNPRRQRLHQWGRA